MIVFVLKVVFAPLMLAMTALVGRRWGARVAGTLAALPVSAGTVTFFVSLEHGAQFGAETAAATLVGIGGLAWFSLGYSHLSRRFGWPVCLAAGYAIIAVSAVAVLPFEQAPGFVVLAYAVLALFVGSKLMPAARDIEPEKPPAWDIPARMATGAILVVVLTALAGALGPQVSGLLNAVPMLSSVLLVFSHRHEGAEHARGILLGFVAGLVATAIFMEIVADGAVRLGIGPAFVLATAACLGYQVLAIRWPGRTSRTVPSEGPERRERGPAASSKRS